MPACCMCYRAINQVLHFSGANVTETHIAEWSLPHGGSQKGR